MQNRRDIIHRMREIILNMDLAEIAISVIALIFGLLIGYAASIIRHFVKDRKFDHDEKRISKQIHKMSLRDIQTLSEQGRIKIDPCIKTLIAKIDRELNSIEIYNRGRSEIEDDIDDLSGILQQLSNA